jgi:catechol-2,3-dioxygenase
MNTTESQSLLQPVDFQLWGVRYQVKDVQRSIEFYTQQLGFNVGASARNGFRKS